MSKEVTLHLPFTKINLKRDSYYYYALPYLINQVIADTIPAGAKTYQLTPSTTLFFKQSKKRIEFGLQNKTTTIIKRIVPMYEEKLNEMRRNYSANDTMQSVYHACYQELPHHAKDYLQVFNDKNETCRFHYLQEERKKLGEKYKVYMPKFSNGRDNEKLLDRYERKIRRAQKEKQRVVFEKKQGVFGKINNFFDMAANFDKLKPKSEQEKQIQPSVPAYNPRFMQPNAPANKQPTIINNTNNINININFSCTIL